MAFKAILLCASVLLVQYVSGNCVNRYIVPSCGCSGRSLQANDYVSISSSGGDFKVTSIGPISPTGIAVASDLSLDGKLDVEGILPFVSAVAFEDCFDTKGSSAVSYGCGDGSIGITNVIGGNAVSNGLANIADYGISSGYTKINNCGCRI